MTVDEPTGDASYLRKLNSTADKPDISQLYPKKAMKAKKKEFLQKKKLRRKQDSKVIGEADGSEDESDLEERVMTDQHKPAFGEQAMQPLKVQQISQPPAANNFVQSVVSDANDDDPF